MTSAEKQLLVQAAIAASNHGLKKQAYDLLAAFPDLIDDVENRNICTSVIYFALNETENALQALSNSQSVRAQGLRLLFSGSGSQAQIIDMLAGE